MSPRPPPVRLPLLPVLLAVAMMLAGVVQARLHAGSHPRLPGAIAVALCSGEDRLWLDASGGPLQPLGRGLICPDCVAALGPALPPTPASLPRPVERAVRAGRGRHRRARRGRRHRPPARAPPGQR